MPARALSLSLPFSDADDEKLYAEGSSREKEGAVWASKHMSAAT